MPIDDVWLTGEPVAAVPGQRLPLDDQPVVKTADEPQRNGAQSEHLPRNGNQGSNGADMTPPNRNNGSTNGSENGGVSGIRPTHTFDPHALDSHTFDPQSFDPGPDLPPLPTLRPLPTIRPLNNWPIDPPPVEQLPDSAPLPQVHPPAVEPAAEVFVERRVAHHAAADHPANQPAADQPAVNQPAAQPDTEPLPQQTAGIQPVRHRRRATDIADPAPETVAAPEPAPAAAPRKSTGPATVQRVLVVGGSGAIGSAVARALAAQGARVAVHHASHAAAAGELVAALPGEGHLSIGADLADSESVADLIRSVDDKFDGIDVVINAASAGEDVSRASVVGSSLADWTDAWTGTLTVDVLGAATVAHAAAAAFVARGHGGRIILLAAKGRPFSGIPNPVGLATEQAVGALGSVLAGELAPYGIGVIVVGSGSAASSGWSPTALAETVAWLASGPTSALPGAVFNIGG